MEGMAAQVRHAHREELEIGGTYSAILAAEVNVVFGVEDVGQLMVN
jgi:hypothetical protein